MLGVWARCELKGGRPCLASLAGFDYELNKDPLGKKLGKELALPCLKRRKPRVTGPLQ